MMRSNRRLSGFALLALALAAFVFQALFASQLSAQAVCEEPWGLQETLRLGSLAGDVVLTHPIDLEVDDDGRIYLTESLVPSVSVFTSEGVPLASIGRAGEGPGELTLTASHLGWKADTLWVTDTDAIHFFLKSGDPVRSVTFRAVVPSERAAYEPRAPLTDGSFLGSATTSGDFVELALDAGRVPIRRFSVEGQILDTLAFISWTSRMVEIAFPDDDDLSHWTFPFYTWLNGDKRAQNPQGTPASDGTGVFVVGDAKPDARQPVIDIVKVGISGDTIVHLAIPYQPKRISSPERDRLEEWFGGWVAGDFPVSEGGRSRTPNEQRRRVAMDALGLPDFHPPVRQLISGHDGTIWILRELTFDRVDRWEVYDETGTLLGRVEIPEGKSGGSTALPWRPRLNVLRATADELWGVTTDDLDVPYVHRFLLQKPCQ